ncbi:MAG: hypothetical protein PHE93_06460 [Clostridia bacterium]|nr:hypothetical protein [Clostridia bacterium]
MSNCLYYAKKYEVEWKGGFFNWKQEEFGTLLDDLSNEYLDGKTITDDFTNSEDIEFDVEILKILVDKMKKDYAGNTEPHPVMTDSNYSTIYTVFKEMYEENKEKSYLRLSWF